MATLWGSIKTYAQQSYYLALAYGHVRSFVQPWVSTTFNANHIEDGVFIGDIASAYNKQELKALGITHIVTAVLGVGPQFPDDFQYLCVPIRDINSEDIKAHLDTTTEFINQAVRGGGKVLVHCVCGVSRSATIVAAWLMAKTHQSSAETIELLQARRGCVNPIPSFRQQLATLEN